MIDTAETLSPKQDQLIYALLKYRTKREAASKAGIPEPTMYRWLRDPAFKAAYRAALHDRFSDGLAVLARNSERSAQALVDVVDDLNEETSARIVAAKAVIDLGFKAQDTIAMQEEMDHLRATLDELKVKKQTSEPAPVDKLERVRNSKVAEDEQAEAVCLRVAWMGEIGHSAQDIEASLRYNRPQSVAEERKLLEVVRKQLDAERMCTGS